MTHRIKRYTWTLALHGALALALALPLHAQRTHVLLVIGLSGDVDSDGMDTDGTDAVETVLAFKLLSMVSTVRSR